MARVDASRLLTYRRGLRSGAVTSTHRHRRYIPFQANDPFKSRKAYSQERMKFSQRRITKRLIPTKVL